MVFGRLVSLPTCALPREDLSLSQQLLSCSNRLTLDKIYEVIDRDGSNVIVLDDDGNKASFHSGRLTLVQPETSVEPSNVDTIALIERQAYGSDATRPNYPRRSKEIAAVRAWAAHYGREVSDAEFDTAVANRFNGGLEVEWTEE